MRKSIIFKTLVGVVAIGVLAFAGTALATTGTSTASAAVTVPAVVQPATDQSQPAPAVVAEPAAASAVDTDTIQDKNGADDATEVGAAEAPESGGVESATEADGPGGHADEPGNPNADHQFEGEE